MYQVLSQQETETRMKGTETMVLADSRQTVAAKLGLRAGGGGRVGQPCY